MEITCLASKGGSDGGLGKLGELGSLCLVLFVFLKYDATVVDSPHLVDAYLVPSIYCCPLSIEGC